MMTNLEKYKNAFCEALEVEESQLAGLKIKDIGTWDSLSHMILVSSLEDAFDIVMDTGDIIALNSFEKGQEILANKYKVEF